MLAVAVAAGALFGVSSAGASSAVATVTRSTSWYFSATAGVPGTSNAFFVGTSYVPTESPVVQFWNGSSMAAQALPAGVGSAFLLGVTAVPGTGDAFAVGTTASNAGLLLSYNGSQWSTAGVPAGVAQLNAVSAASSSSAWAVGGSGSAPSNGVLLRWNGKKWSKVTNSALGAGTYLSAVSEVSKSDVWAVGSTAAAGLALHWNGSKWVDTSLPPSTGPLTAVAGVPGTADAWAISNGSGGSVILFWNGSAWSEVATPALGGYSYLLSVSASSSSDAWIGGLVQGPSTTQDTLALHWTGAQWSQVPTPDPNTVNALDGVADMSASSGWAAGSTGTGCGGPTRGLALRWNGSKWTSLKTKSPLAVATSPGTPLRASPIVNC